MLATLSRIVGISIIALFSGCAMCANCDDYTYPTEGGRWQRLDPTYGRVGSLFTPEVWTKADEHGEQLPSEQIETPQPSPGDDLQKSESDAPESPPATGDEPPAPAAEPEASVLQRRGTTNR